MGLALAACSDDGESGGERAAAAPAKPDGPLHCERLLPDALVEEHFPAARVEDGATATSVAALCRLAGGDRPAEIGYTCVGDPARGLERARASAKTGVRDLPGVAGGAFVLSYGPSTPRVTLFIADDDTGCWVSASVPAGRDHRDLALDLAGALSPEAIAGD